jgi:hypothetical protein
LNLSIDILVSKPFLHSKGTEKLTIQDLNKKTGYRKMQLVPLRPGTGRRAGGGGLRAGARGRALHVELY